MTLPNSFESESQYYDWIESIASEELDEMIDCGYDPEEDDVYAWANQTPQLDDVDTMEWINVHDDVMRYTNISHFHEKIDLPADDVLERLASYTRDHVRLEISRAAAQEAVERGYEV